nr:PREDICTED: reversion-inducing cysteine-rich protein with Kazal motifs-like [Apteryx mantelli mantelli]
MCRDVCEQILSSKSDSRLKHLLQRAPEYCPESMGEVWGCINSSLPERHERLVLERLWTKAFLRHLCLQSQHSVS